MKLKDKIITITFATLVSTVVITFATAMAWALSIIFGH